MRAIKIHGSAGTFSRAFSTGFRQLRLRTGRMAYANTRAPLLPGAIASNVQAIVGLDNLQRRHPAGIVRPRPATVTPRPARRSHVVTTGPQPCAAAATAATSDAALTADQFASAYDMNGPYAAGDLGAGQTIAMFELETNLPADIAAFQTCYGTSTVVSYVKVDGYSASDTAGGEATLDIENAIGAAPGAAQLVYQGPNSDAGALDTFNAIISDNQATVISNSWGLCEPFISADDATAENTMFEEAATQGQSMLDASGDDGSEDCGTNDLAVDDPGGQPFMTVVGGTRLTTFSSPPTETTWNDAEAPAAAASPRYGQCRRTSPVQPLV